MPYMNPNRKSQLIKRKQKPLKRMQEETTEFFTDLLHILLPISAFISVGLILILIIKKLENI